MTTMGLNYLVYEETKRSNLAKEGENYRSNTTREKENFRSNVVGEVETQRHNRMTENLGWGTLSEQQRANLARENENFRSNQARESETFRSNQANEGQRSRDLEERQYQYDMDNLTSIVRSGYSTTRRGIRGPNKNIEAVLTGVDYWASLIPAFVKVGSNK